MAEPDLRIRPAALADLESLVEFNAAMAFETEDKVLDRERLTRGVRAVLDDPKLGRYWVAEREQRPAGALLVTYEWSDWRNGLFWWIQSVYVPPDERRRGVYTALYRHVEALARSEHDVCGLRLYVDAGNTRAHAAYERLGMRAARYRLYEADFVLGE